MEEQLNIIPVLEGQGDRALVLYLNGEIILIKGRWQWEFASDLVFCSDVILSDYKSFEGTKAILHPDDIDVVKEHLRFLRATSVTTLRFRVITTYGEVRWLKGINVVEQPAGQLLQFCNFQEVLLKEAQLKEAARESALLRLAQTGYESGERAHHTGSWYINAATNDTWYSDEVFRIYGLPPQSVNSYPNTFTRYIHPDDSDAVIESMEKAWQLRLPLHIDFRIVRANGEERYVRQILQWKQNEKGEDLQFGVVADVSEHVMTEEDLVNQKAGLYFQKQVQKLQDEVTQTGHWYIDLLTRKAVYSENYYRIFRIKPQLLTGEINQFINYVYADDKREYAEAMRRMYFEHKPPYIEFRIIRADGKLRYLRQTARVEIFNGSEMMMVGVLEDITQRKALEKKALEMEEKAVIMSVVTDNAEELGKTGTLTWDVEQDRASWSANLFRLLGYKPHILQPTTWQILKYIHPGFRKLFNDQLRAVLNEESTAVFELQVFRLSEPRLFKVMARLVQHEGHRFVVCTFRDIHDEHLEQLQVAEKIRIADLLTSNIPDNVIITNEENRIVFWNNQCEESYGLKRDSVIRRNFFEVFPKLREDNTVHDFQEALRGNAIHHYNIPSPFQSGYINVHRLPLRTSDSQVSGIMHIVQDVTGQVAVREELQQQLQLLGKILSSTVDRMVAFNKDLEVVFWNRAAELHYAMKMESVLGKPLQEIFPGIQHDPAFAGFRRALAGETIHVEPEQALKDGLYHQTWLIPVKDEKGQVGMVLWLSHDFSSEYRQLSEQKKAFDVLQAVNEICFELDHDGRFRFLNRHTELWWNKRGEELLGQNIWKVFPELVDSSLYFAINHALESGELVRREFPHRGMGRNVFVNITPTIDGVIVTMIDLSAVPSEAGA